MYREPKTASSHVCALIFAPVGHTSLHAKRCFSIILRGFSFFDLLFLDAELRTYPPGVVGKKDAAIIRDQHFGNTVPANRSIEDSEKGFGILAHRDS
jgi:hypothetical protein